MVKVGVASQLRQLISDYEIERRQALLASHGNGAQCPIQILEFGCIQRLQKTAL